MEPTSHMLEWIECHSPGCYDYFCDQCGWSREKED